MKIDLCKIFGVEEGEEFKVEECEWAENTRYVIQDNYLLVVEPYNSTYKSNIELNDLVGGKVTKLPKKKEFTDDELCILRNIDKKFKWICRELRTDNILLFKEKPLRHDSKAWVCDEGTVTFFRAFDHLFNSIQWEDEEPVFIDDYVERC